VSKRSDGGPVFPSGDFRSVQPVDGMSLRDYFAAKAIDAAFKFYDDGYCGTLGDKTPAELVATVAYEIADAMVKAREAK
jgi:ABC-type nitrate/sulfonate/bicarbonate transport system substrate-binding protein